MTLKTARGTLALLAIEDDRPDILFETLPGSSVPLWPDVRSGFMSAMQSHDFGSSAVEPAPSPRSSAWMQLGRSLLPSRWDARGLRSPRSALYVVAGGTTHRVGDSLRNWLVGDFVERFPDDSAVLQWNAIGSPAPTFAMTRSLDPATWRAAGYARLSRRAVDEAHVRRLVREFAVRLDDRITDDQIDAIASSAAYSSTTAPFVESQFARVLDRVRPRIVLMEDASYGGRSGIVALMKRRGILVAEPQHGWIGPTHGAYNFGAAMRSPELAATLPDELLTFGEYWSEGIRHPARAIAIGKPHLESMAALAPDWNDRPREVLLVSSIADPAQMEAFGLALRAALPREWIVRFRPHPSERASVATRYPDLLAHPGIGLDSNSDVYESLATARGVVGVASTVLFEALAMGCRVYVKDSPFSDYYTGDLFGPVIASSEDVGQIAQNLAGDRAWSSARSPGTVWKQGSTANFAEWMRSRLGEAS